MNKLLVILMILTSTFFMVIPAFAFTNLDQVNQKICDRFEEDTARLAGIMEEIRARAGIKETRVAFGGSDTPIKNADYWITFAAEAIAYHRAQKFSSTDRLRSSLEVLKGKVLRAKNEVGKTIDE